MLLGAFFASGLLMLKLKRSCEQIKRQASWRQLNWHWPEKHCPGTCKVSQHHLQMACMKLISHARTAPLFLHPGHNRQMHVGNSIPALRGVDRGRNSLPKQSAATTGARKCHRCGREDHNPRNFRFKSYECRNCGKKGHLQTLCRSRGAT